MVSVIPFVTDKGHHQVGNPFSSTCHWRDVPSFVMESSSWHSDILPIGSTSGPSPYEGYCDISYAIGVAIHCLLFCAAQLQTVSHQCHVQALRSRARVARTRSYPEHHDLCTASHGYAGGAGRDDLCVSSGGLMHETPSPLGTRLLFRGHLRASSAPSSSEAPTNTSQVLPTPCRCLSRALMRVCMETLPLREAQFL